MNTTISREDLIEAIEAGIAALEYQYGPDVPTYRVNALRAVARTTAVISYGAYTTVGAGCPVKMAFPTRWNRMTWDTAFVAEYDKAMRRMNYEPATALKVIDEAP